MTYKDILDKLQTLTPEQLNQTAEVYINDEVDGEIIEDICISGDDLYWTEDYRCVGNLKEVKEQLGDKWESEKDDLLFEPAGTVSFQCNLKAETE